MMVNGNSQGLVRDYRVEIGIRFDVDELVEDGERQMFNMRNVKKEG